MNSESDLSSDSSSDSDENSIFRPARAQTIKRNLEEKLKRDQLSTSQELSDSFLVTDSNKRRRKNTDTEYINSDNSDSYSPFIKPIAPPEPPPLEPLQLDEASLEAERIIRQATEESKSNLSFQNTLYKDQLNQIDQIYMKTNATSNELKKLLGQPIDSSQDIEILSPSSPVIDRKTSNVSKQNKNLQSQGTTQEIIEISDSSSSSEEEIDFEDSDQEIEREANQLDQEIEKRVSQQLQNVDFLDLDKYSSTISSRLSSSAIQIVPKGSISVSVRMNEKDNDRTSYIIKLNEPFSILIDKIKKDKQVTSVTLLFDGEELQPEDTPADMDMEIDDLIDAKYQSNESDPYALLPSNSQILTSLTSLLRPYIHRYTMKVTLIIGSRQIQITVPKDLNTTLFYQIVSQSLHWNSCIISYHNERVPLNITFQKLRVVDRSLFIINYDSKKKST